MLDKQAIYKRALEHNSKDGRTIKALDKVFNTIYPEGTNLLIEFIKLFKGLPYGDNAMSLDKKADCSQFWINVLYIWFGIDYLGSYTESIWDAAVNHKHGTIYTTFQEAPLLSLCGYKLSDRNPHLTHMSGKTGKERIGDTRSAIHPFNPSRDWDWYTNRIKLIVDFITLTQHESIIYHVAPTPKPEDPPKPKYPKYQYKGSSYMNLRSGPSKKNKDIGNIYRGAVVEKIGQNGSWWHVYANGIEGWTFGKYFKKA